MLNIRKFAAIDIGSNAIRLLIQDIIEAEDEPLQFRKNALVRVPVRLGQDAFTTGKITEANTERISDTVQAFKLIMKVHGVEKYMACATSAMREAVNGEAIVTSIYKETDVKIEIIGGKREAEIIAATDLNRFIEKDETYLYVDVGGGSTEFTLFSEGKTIASKSFKIGTVRLLNKMVKTTIWSTIEQWIKVHTASYKDIVIIASGGNINKLFKMSGLKPGEPLPYIWLNAQYDYLKGMTYEDRISKLGLNADRADVIVPATRIYLSAAKWSGAGSIHVPKIGLSDGIIRLLYTTEKDRSV
ncbi:MAG: exopolyphosphatase [Bacteroidota bacterium]